MGVMAMFQQSVLSFGLYSNGFNERAHVGRYFLRAIWSCNLVNHHDMPRWSDT